MLHITHTPTKDVMLKAIFKEDQKPNNLVEKDNFITEFLHENVAYIYLGEKESFCLGKLDETTKILSSLPRTYQLDVKSFLTSKVTFDSFIESIYKNYLFINNVPFSLKTTNDKKETDLILVKAEELPCPKLIIDELEVLMDSVNFARKLQATPPNICNSEWLAEEVKTRLSKLTNLSVKVLNKKEIEEEKMGLLLSVNRGSVYEPRVVVIEYKGNPDSDKKTVLVGKGITFDSGGYNIKTGKYMNGMKYDMSGAAIAAATLEAIAKLSPKANFSAVMQITDNRVNGDASLPDSVWTSKSGKTVEVNNTDAEGRLILADGITYAIENLKATKVVTIATLTGAILSALGHIFTGVWSTSDESWASLELASKKQRELLWRMPFHKAFSKNIKSSNVADLKNTDLSGLGGSNSAAMFLKEFVTKDVEFIHLDIAGTADINENPTGVLVRTLTQLALNDK